MVGKGLQARGILHTNLALPNITGSCARGADRIGCFGLVGRRLTNCYHGLACESPRGMVDLVWSYDTLPTVTKSPIWICPCRVRPLPTSTSATKGTR
jgi:hypothetical protein